MSEDHGQEGAVRMSAPRAPWVHIGRPAAQRPPGVPGAVSLETVSQALSSELGLTGSSIRRGLEKAVRRGELARVAGGGRRGASVWILLDDARRWALAHYRRPNGEDRTAGTAGHSARTAR